MIFTVLGSGTALPDPDRGAAGFAVGTDAGTWWIDGGPGTLQRSARFGVDPLALRGVVYSHRHPDHCAELPGLLFAGRVARRTAPLTLVGGTGLAAHLSGLQAAYEGRITPATYPVEVRELPVEASHTLRLDARLTLRTAPAAHGAAALHLRFEADGVSVVFSGDTAPSPALIDLAVGCDLLVCECAGSDAEPVPGHLRPSDVLAVVQAARPRRVWLTHLYPHVDPHQAVATVARAGAPVTRVADGTVWRGPGAVHAGPQDP